MPGFLEDQADHRQSTAEGSGKRAIKPRTNASDLSRSAKAASGLISRRWLSTAVVIVLDCDCGFRFADFDFVPSPCSDLKLRNLLSMVENRVTSGAISRGKYLATRPEGHARQAHQIQPS
jgi:hypothetical protein